jgi:hypothetical protein
MFALVTILQAAAAYVPVASLAAINMTTFIAAMLRATLTETDVATIPAANIVPAS